MLKNYNPKVTQGSLFICNKCGQGFSDPKPEHAEKLKSELRSELKVIDLHKKIRVMTSGCLGLCQKDEQTFVYSPNFGEIEMLTTSSDFQISKNDILGFVKTKV